MITQHPYIERQQTTKLAQDIKAAISQPQSNPLLFSIHGKVGVGKSTTINQLKDIFGSKFQYAKISFSFNSPIRTVINLMAALNKQLVSDPDDWDIDTFQELNQEYEETCQKLALEAAKEESSATKGKTAESIKQSIQTAIPGIVTSITQNPVAASIGAPLLSATVDGVFDVANILKKSKLTKDNLELQEFIKNPILKLAQAFIQTITQKSQYKPILLLLDNYDQATWEIDTFLCQFILSSTELQNSPITIVTAGKSSIRSRRYKGIYQQHRQLILEKQLKEFNFEETENYLLNIGITNANDIRLCWNTTKGYPYHLNLIRQQKEDGKQIHLSYGVNEMLKIILDGLNDIEKKVISLAAYCRWFDRQVIEYLLKNNNVETNPPGYTNWFEWLIDRNFVIEDRYYHLDDVSRGVIRQAEHKIDRGNFNNIHRQLADYYQQLANNEIDDEEFDSDKYQCAEWCIYIVESNYHRLYASKKQGQVQLLNCFFEGAFFSNPNVAINSYLAVVSEYDIDTNNLLPSDTNNFLYSVYLAINCGWLVLTEDPKEYKLTLDNNGQSIKPQVEKSLLDCYQKTDYLDYLPQINSLISQVYRQKTDRDKFSLLKKAKQQLKKIEDNQNPKVAFFIFSYLGNMFYKLKKQDEAIKIYQKAIEIDSENTGLLNNMGGYFYDNKEYDKALITLKKAIEIDSQEATFYGNMGVILEAKNENYQALESFKKALDLEPDNYINWMNHGFVLAKMKKYHRAICSFDKSLALNSNNALTLINYSNTLFNLKRYPEASNMIDRAICIDSREIDIWLRINAILCHLECFERAAECLEKALSIHCNNIDALYAKGINQYYLNDFEKAIKVLNRVVDMNPDETIKIDCHNLMALCLSLLQKFAQSFRQIETALEYSPNDNLLVANKGIILARQGNYSEAISYCESAITINPDNENGYYAKACCYSLQNNKEQTIQNLAKAIEIAPLRCRLEAKVNPDFNHLKSSTEFQALLESDLQLLNSQ